MKVNRWLAVLLLASWTLNVALVVALFLRNDGIPDRIWPGNIPPPHMMHDGPPPFAEHFESLRDEMSPIVRLRSRIADKMASAFEADVLDTALIRSLGDSLVVYHARLQDRFIQHLYELHSDLSPEMRKRLSRRIAKRMGAEVNPQFLHQMDKDRHRSHRPDVPRRMRDHRNLNNEGD